MNKNVERGQATRAHLIDVATRLFAAHGYDGTSVAAVLAESGVSRGSLYHHFPGKDALFWAVLEGVAARVGQQVADAEARCPGPGCRAAGRSCLAWIRLAGATGCRADRADRRACGAGLAAVATTNRTAWCHRAALTYAAESGSIERRHVDTFAHIVLAATNEVTLMIARADDPAAALGAGESAVAEFLDRLLGDPGTPVASTDEHAAGLRLPQV